MKRKTTIVKLDSRTADSRLLLPITQVLLLYGRQQTLGCCRESTYGTSHVLSFVALTIKFFSRSTTINRLYVTLNSRLSVYCVFSYDHFAHSTPTKKEQKTSLWFCRGALHCREEIMTHGYTNQPFYNRKNPNKNKLIRLSNRASVKKAIFYVCVTFTIRTGLLLLFMYFTTVQQ